VFDVSQTEGEPLPDLDTEATGDACDVVGRYCGLDTSGSAFYLAAWESDGPEIVREHLGQISTTTEEIIDALGSSF